ncbi:hypothetical protein AVEN_105936-1 [Araneus ventricosus]|uniref:Uncharacterized protein n=1 Tax=Araneus ventricosus TaxID=182803 RepID=A0A4Y2DYG3_ARAVE|nr:hypothetical protein AVEN_105936-1 [Araneus ventricosus]
MVKLECPWLVLTTGFCVKSCENERMSTQLLQHSRGFLRTLVFTVQTINENASKTVITPTLATSSSCSQRAAKRWYNCLDSQPHQKCEHKIFNKSGVYSQLPSRKFDAENWSF